MKKRCPQSSITWPEGDREVLRSRRGFLVLCSLKMAMAMKPAVRLDFGGADRHLGTRGFSGTLSTRVGPPAALSGPTVLPRTKGAPSLAATPWRPCCRGSPGVCYLRSARSTDGLTPSFIPNLPLNSYPCVSLRRYRTSTASRSKHRGSFLMLSCRSSSLKSAVVRRVLVPVL